MAIYQPEASSPFWWQQRAEIIAKAAQQPGMARRATPRRRARRPTHYGDDMRLFNRADCSIAAEFPGARTTKFLTMLAARRHPDRRMDNTGTYLDGY
jgi:hypothetical protein